MCGHTPPSSHCLQNYLNLFFKDFGKSSAVFRTNDLNTSVVPASISILGWCVNIQICTELNDFIIVMNTIYLCMFCLVDQFQQRCCKADCYTTASCKTANSNDCATAPVECAMGECILWVSSLVSVYVQEDATSILPITGPQLFFYYCSSHFIHWNHHSSLCHSFSNLSSQSPPYQPVEM